MSEVLVKPNFCHATPVQTFNLSRDWTATFLENVISTDRLRYHYLLAVQQEQANAPELWIASEWNATESETFESPRIGMFSATGHLGLGSDPRWMDPSLFLLQAVELARVQINRPANGLGDPETWAISRMWALIRQRLKDVERPELLADYRSAVANYQYQVQARIRQLAGI